MSLNQKIARFDSELDRLTRLAASRSADGAIAPPRRRGSTGWAKKVAAAAIAIGLVMIATIVIGVVVNGIGLGGLGLSLLAMAAVVAFFLMPRREKPIVDYKEDMPNQAVVQRLDTLLVRKRAALPAPAARTIDAISRQLPLLESRLAETETLDPLAQDARRLMGKHLPELIERYERVPAAYRAERDGEGLTVDERLVQGLDAAKTALDDLGRKLAHEDLQAFETKGRFIESRYKEDQGLGGQ
ncbi:MAG: hypothetical protein QOG13_1964 [Sphingomonadales bacterium]|jgi:hypothetical protein|nr:hypothetical protein [Sphingomonadales bacterium]